MIVYFMMKKMRKIECRYEWLSSTGVKWTDWFKYDNIDYNEDNVNDIIKGLLKNGTILKNIDKVTKMYHEFRAV